MPSPKLPILSASKVCRILKKDGFHNYSQNGSHKKFKKYLDNNLVLTVIVPIHNKKIGKGLLLTIIEQAGHNKESFLELI